jgi:hypothetical protein
MANLLDAAGNPRATGKWDNQNTQERRYQRLHDPKDNELNVRRDYAIEGHEKPSGWIVQIRRTTRARGDLKDRAYRVFRRRTDVAVGATTVAV